MDFSSSRIAIGLKFQLLLFLCLLPVTMVAQRSNFAMEFIPEKYNPKSFSVPVPDLGMYTFPLKLSKPDKTITPIALESKNLIYLVHAETLSFDQMISPDYQVFSGDVQFRHEGALMFCDSAHFYQTSNSLYAFGNVHMEQGDSLFLYGAWMFYEGYSKLAKVRDKVRLENKGVTLFTDSLNYDRVTDIGYFFDGGLLVDSTNELSSQYGQYSPDTKLAEFKNDVKLTNPNFVLTTRKLNYNTETKVADIVSPTEIVSDSGYIYSTSGWYNTITEESRLLNRSFAINDKKRIIADTLFYNRAKEIGEGFGKVEIEDSIQQVTMKGEYGYNDGVKDSSILIKNALFIDHSSEDTFYLHADTLISYKITVYGNPKPKIALPKKDSIVSKITSVIPKKAAITNVKDSLVSGKDSLISVKGTIAAKKDSLSTGKDYLAQKNDSNSSVKIPVIAPRSSIIAKRDSAISLRDAAINTKDTTVLKKDSVFRVVKAFTGVRFFRKDIQGICDTLNYSSRDSVLNLINQPVIWNENQQLTGEYMKLYTYKNKPKMLHVLKSAMAVAYETDSFYNQFSGKELKAFFDSSEVVRVELSGNAEAVFLPRDENNEMMGFNRMEGSSMTIFRKHGKMEKLVLWPQPKGKFYPLEKLDPQAKYLKNFEWLEALRPKNPGDVLSETPNTRLKNKSVKGKSETGTTEKKSSVGEIGLKETGEISIKP